MIYYLLMFSSLVYIVLYNSWLDPEYVEFLEQIAKPIENLPSAEIQLERKEAERAGQLFYFLQL